MAAYRNEQALGLVERGLALAAGPSDRFELLCLRGEILHDLGAMTEAGVAFAAALEAAPDEGARCRASLGLAAVKRVTEDLDGAFADLERAEAAARRLSLNAQLARIHFLRGNLHFPRSEIEACLVEHQKSLEFAQAAGSAELEAAALGGLGDAEYVPRPHADRARLFRTLHRALPSPRLGSHRGGEPADGGDHPLPCGRAGGGSTPTHWPP